MTRWNCMALGPTTQDHIDIILAGWDKRTNWLRYKQQMTLCIEAVGIFEYVQSKGRH